MVQHQITPRARASDHFGNAAHGGCDAWLRLHGCPLVLCSIWIFVLVGIPAMLGDFAFVTLAPVAVAETW